MNIPAAGVFMVQTSDVLSSDSLANRFIIKDIRSFLESIYRRFSIRFLYRARYHSGHGHWSSLINAADVAMSLLRLHPLVRVVSSAAKHLTDSTWKFRVSAKTNKVQMMKYKYTKHQTSYMQLHIRFFNQCTWSHLILIFFYVKRICLNLMFV